MLFGLTTKEMVIGGIAIAGVTNGIVNSVKVHNLKKRVSVIETDIGQKFENIANALPPAPVKTV